MRGGLKVIGFFVPAVASAGSETFAQHLVVAGVSGAFGVAGVTLAAYITTRRSRDRIEKRIKDHLEVPLPPTETTNGGDW